MLVINLCYPKFFKFLNLFKKNKIVRLVQFTAEHQKKDLWKLIFSNGVTKIVKLFANGYRSRWWLVLNFQTLDAKESYSIVISRFTYQKEIFQNFSAYLWSYV
jgi:hypothetical protein